MGRPNLDPEARRIQVAVRFGPLQFAVLKAAAGRSGLSLGKEVERRVMESIARELRDMER